jgi:signal transduction histidine kinase
MGRYYKATGLALGALALALLALQLLTAARLARRVATMIGFLPKMRAGDDGGGLPADGTGDELAALRDALAASAARLAEAREEQERLIANAAHELRTPLTVMRTELDLALRRERPAAELRDALAAVRADVERLGGLATELLDLQAVRHLGFGRRDGDLGDVAREACAAIRTLADAQGVALEVAAPAEAAARFDERALRQAVDNLIGNALRYAPRGSTVTVSVTREDGRWRLAVADRGPGIPAAEAERVFQPFQRLEAGSTGGGLGLTIVREVARRHGGDAWVELSHQPGAMLCIAIPDAAAGAPEPAAPRGEAYRRPSGDGL